MNSTGGGPILRASLSLKGSRGLDAEAGSTSKKELRFRGNGSECAWAEIECKSGIE